MNYPKSIITLAGGKHEGDWEHITVELNKDLTPNSVYYAFHGSGKSYNWSHSALSKYSDLGVLDTSGTHVLVNVARGSHASYPSKNEIHTLGLELLGINFDSGILNDNFTPSNNKWFSSQVPNQLINVGEKDSYGGGVPSQVFMRYSGKWGDRGWYPQVSGLTPVDGPRTMSKQGSWNYLEKIR